MVLIFLFIIVIKCYILYRIEIINYKVIERSNYYRGQPPVRTFSSIHQMEAQEVAINVTDTNILSLQLFVGKIALLLIVVLPLNYFFL